jgi:cobaltochelatase CobS
MSPYGTARLSAAKSGSTPNAPSAASAVTAAAALTVAATPESGAADSPEYLYFGSAQLPILAGLSEHDQAQVPEHDANYRFWNKDALEATATAIELDLNLLLVGPTGCGKTSMVEELGALCNAPVKRVNLDGDVRSSDFLGQMMIVVDEDSGQTVTEWVDGVLPQAMRNGWWLILDEMDAAPAPILMTLQAVLESGHRLTLKENGGETIKAHPRFRIIATANTLGRGDESGLYVGTNVLNEATLDRFGIVVEYGYAPVHQEAAIVRAKTGIDAATAKSMCSVAKKIRDGRENDECTCTFSTRRILNWATLALKLGDNAKAAKFSVLQRLGSDDREYVGGVMQRVMGGDF